MISFSDRAVAKVKEYADQMPEAAGKDLRLFIQGIGCGGFSYGFTFDEERDGDTVVDDGNLKVLVDANSAPHLEGARIDFVEDQRGAGFTVDNPNSPEMLDGGGCGGGCSCG
jgi:iron-sulfur cluster assembly accessory protein